MCGEPPDIIRKEERRVTAVFNIVLEFLVEVCLVPAVLFNRSV